MKYLKLLMMLLLAAFTMAACGDDEEVAVEVSPSVLNFTSQGGSDRISISGAAADAVTMPAADEWYKLTLVPGNSASCIVRVEVALSEVDAPRTANLVFKINGKDYTVALNQEASRAAQAVAFSRSLGMGWNLGNQLDAQNTWQFDTPMAEETCWGNPLCTQTTMDGLKAKGIESVRIPVTWAGHIGAAPGYTIDAAWMNRVAEVVGYAKKAGLKAIVNLHHDEGNGETDPKKAGWLDLKNAALNPSLNDAIEAKLAAVWRQIAERFKDEGEWLIFESMNELQDGGWGWGANRNDGGKQYACLNHWQQVFVDAVRAVGGQNTNRWLCVVGYAQNPELTIEHLALPTDPTPGRLAVAVHCYDPGDYCLTAKDAQWGHTGNVTAHKSGEQQIENLFKRIKETYVNQGLPVILGEMGCVNRATDVERSFQKYYLEYVTRCAWTYGLAPFLWDNGTKSTGNESFGFIDHGTGEYINYASEIIPMMVRAATDSNPEYNLESIYATAP